MHAYWQSSSSSSTAIKSLLHVQLAELGNSSTLTSLYVCAGLTLPFRGGVGGAFEVNRSAASDGDDDDDGGHPSPMASQQTPAATTLMTHTRTHARIDVDAPGIRVASHTKASPPKCGQYFWTNKNRTRHPKTKTITHTHARTHIPKQLNKRQARAGSECERRAHHKIATAHACDPVAFSIAI